MSARSAERCTIDPIHVSDGPRDETDREFHNLVHEVVRLMLDEELFAFVVHGDVSATNNDAERSLRGAALDRRTGRTSKTVRGARRRTVLVSAFETLKLYLPKFTLTNVVEEVVDWYRTGESRFSKLRVRCETFMWSKPASEKDADTTLNINVCLRSYVLGFELRILIFGIVFRQSCLQHHWRQRGCRHQCLPLRRPSGTS